MRAKNLNKQYYCTSFHLHNPVNTNADHYKCLHISQKLITFIVISISAHA